MNLTASTKTPDLPRFVVDVMLGRLAKWLRIVGYDSLYRNDYDDDHLAHLARSQERCLLTRDSRLTLRKSLRGHCLLIESVNLWEQLRQTIADLHLEIRDEQILSRCTLCNSLLLVAPADRVSNRVPAYVRNNRRTFRICPSCGRVYWRGTHRRQIVSVLDRLTANPSLLDLPASDWPLP